MNEINTEMQLQGIFLTKLPIFRGTNPVQINSLSVLEVLKIIEVGENGHKELVQNIQRRIPTLSKKSYKKEKSKKILHTSIHCNYDNERRHGNNVKDFTGIVLLEFDDIPKSEIENLKKLLIEHSFVIAAYKSVSGRGVHAWVYCAGIENMDDYKAVWRQLAITLYNLHGISVCTESNLSTQLVCLSYDPVILYNLATSPWRYRIDDQLETDYFKTFGKKKVTNTICEVDIPSVDTDLYLRFTDKFINASYYFQLVLIDKISGHPVSYLNLEYNPNQHSFTKSISREYISKLRYKNQSNTVGKLEYKYAAISLSINGKRKICDGERKATLISWLATYALILKFQFREFTLSELVTLAHVLNDNICYDEYYNRSPIVARHLEFVINVVWNIIQTENYQPTFSPHEHIFNNDLLRECGEGNTTETFHSVYMSEIRKLNKEKYNDNVYTNLIQFEKSLSAIQIEEIKTKKKLYEYLALFCDVSFQSAKNWINKAVKEKGINEENYPVLSLILLTIDQHDTFLIFNEAMDKLFAETQIIKQKDVIKLLNKDMKIATVKRHWKTIKPKVTAHNNPLRLIDCKYQIDKQYTISHFNPEWQIHYGLLVVNGKEYQSTFIVRPKGTMSDVPEDLKIEPEFREYIAKVG